MKYPIKPVVIPQAKRQEINQKILHIIETGLETVISKPDIFLAYTGDGGLHGLERSDFENFHSYTESKREVENGQFFTPHALCQFLVECIEPTVNDLVADLTFGMGNFFNYLPVEQNVYGTEYDIKAYKVAKHLYPEANLECKDIRYYEPGVTFDVVFGNPPFNLKWEYKKDTWLSQLFYCIKAAELLKPAGILALIVPNSFLADDFMDGGMIKEMNQRFSFVAQFDLPSNAFKALGVESFETKVMIFQKISEHIEAIPYSTEKMDAPVFTIEGAHRVHEAVVKPLIEAKDKVKHKLMFERMQQSHADKVFGDQVRKFLFDIKRNPLIREKHAKSAEYVDQYYTQKKPDGMPDKEWEQKRLTKNKVLSYLRRIVKNQHHKEEDRIALVKTPYGLKLKGYSAKSKRQITKEGHVKEMSFNDMILNDRYPFSDTGYQKLVNRKAKAFEVQNERFKDMEVTRDLAEYLRNASIYDAGKGVEIRLNEKQQYDLGIEMQKRYGILNWQMGSGKTIASVIWYRKLLAESRVRNVFVVSAALAINLTWMTKLADFGEDYIMIRKLADIAQIKPGQVVLLSFNMVVKYKKHIQKFIKMQSQKVALIVDESDELSNYHSARTKATLACFRRVKYKLETTGTTTRNTINELYGQLELLYNNSINMICDCDTVYKLNKEYEIEEHDNPYYMQPFPAYHGLSLFKSCFSPSKVTVFGVKKHTQDIYNRSSLEHLIEKTIITRKFQDIVGRKMYDIITHRIQQNDAERAVYGKIIKEFHSMLHYFRKLGNSRKESMLKLVRQIQLLIQSTSGPHRFAEYGSAELPTKYEYNFKLVEKFANEKVAIGSVNLETAVEYAQMLQERFPDRPVFLVKGDVVFKRRSKVIQDFEASRNGILVSTQQSLKSSVNIPTCNKVIVETLPWNVPKLEQYYFRFIRFDSTEDKEIHLVTYNWTIEQNLLALLMAKERINDFIKTLEFKEESDIFDEFGIELDVLNTVIEKEQDAEGNFYLSWGEQKVS